MSRAAYPGQDVTFEAAADLSALQWTAMKYAPGIAGHEDCTVTGALEGERAMGILQDMPAAAGLGARVRTSGFSLAKVDGSGEAIAAGDTLAVGPGGVLVKAGEGDAAIGFAAAASTAAGDIIQIQIAHHTAAGAGAE